MSGNWTTFKKKDILDRIRAKKAGRLKLGVTYLDDVFSGIENNDLILLSAFSGAGKTQLASHIAASNALNGVKVHYFALEAEKQEIQMRICYRLATSKLFGEIKNPTYPVRYKLYAKGLIDPRFDEYANHAEKYAEIKFKENLKIFYRTSSGFGIKDFIKQIEEIDSETQLIVVDHLHYFDYDLSSEYKSISEIIKKIRDVNLEYDIPIILVTQLNRPDRRIKRIIPDLDDIHGSSNLGKICTKAIFISKNRSLKTTDKLAPTLIRAAKFREEMSATNYVGLINFELDTNKYSEGYHIARLTDFDSSYELLLDHEIPYWAENAKTEKTF